MKNKYELVEKALHYYEVANHLLMVTFSLAKDPKILLGVLDNLAQASEIAMEASLSCKMDYFPVNFNEKLILYRKFAPKEFADFISQLHELNHLHKNCPVEFRRGNTLVMCSKNYELCTLSLTQIKLFLKKVEEIIESNKKQ